MKKTKKSKYEIYLSDETKGSTKYVIKGNGLTCRWVGNAILIWSENNSDPDFVNLLGRMENERSRMVKLLFKNGITKW